MGEVFVYDGYISIPASIKYDFIVIETAEDLRPLFPSEIMLPRLKRYPRIKREQGNPLGRGRRMLQRNLEKRKRAKQVVSVKRQRGGLGNEPPAYKS